MFTVGLLLILMETNRLLGPIGVMLAGRWEPIEHHSILLEYGQKHTT